ncbi:hypothetical protein T11_16607 [Trichinella zimbabwensis]|uniref:Uncharacterized protein n=1 Tax=Trichinella zimbabwensis TaxID=268475 RepID=A0A0V1GXN8_9BILA|nr:hypothetical protein T11_16607 [Trichinella zimbabwensis]
MKFVYFDFLSSVLYSFVICRVHRIAQYGCFVSIVTASVASGVCSSCDKQWPPKGDKPWKLQSIDDSNTCSNFYALLTQQHAPSTYNTFLFGGSLHEMLACIRARNHRLYRPLIISG